MTRITYVIADRVTGDVLQWGSCREPALAALSNAAQAAIAWPEPLTDETVPTAVDPATLPPAP